jgi:peptidoglycan/LPS O-acetylase OafA/YrhL
VDNSRIRSLDGLRALSIGLVVLGHLGGTRGFPLGAGAFAGALGVRVFFVISGFLITRLLIEEQERSGVVRLSRFYFKRIFRIFVPYYAFLFLIASAARFGWVQLAPGDLGYALFYLSDHHLHSSWAHGGWTLGHTWSLAVEEQFYLLWPLLLVALGKRRALFAASATLLLSPMLRLFIWYLRPDESFAIGKTAATVVDTIAMGCLLAGLRDHLGERYLRFLRSRWFAVVPAAIAASALLEDRPRLAFTVGAGILNLGIALCIDRCLRLPGSAVTKALASAPLVAIGRASYSIYLWQQPLLNRYAEGLPSSFPRNLVALVLLATAAYWLLEKPSLFARAALERRLTFDNTAGTSLRIAAAAEYPPPRCSPGPDCDP